MTVDVSKLKNPCTVDLKLCIIKLSASCIKDKEGTNLLKSRSGYDYQGEWLEANCLFRIDTNMT